MVRTCAAPLLAAAVLLSPLACARGVPRGVPRAQVSALPDVPPPDARVSWFDETGGELRWRITDARGGGTVELGTLPGRRLDSASYDAAGRHAVFLTREGPDWRHVENQRVLVADLARRELLRFDSPEEYVYVAGIDERGPFFVGSSFRRDPSRIAAFVRRLIGRQTCIPAVARFWRFEARSDGGAAWSLEASREAGCEADTGPTATLLAESMGHGPRQSSISAMQSVAAGPALREQLGDAAGLWRLAVEGTRGGVAFLPSSDVSSHPMQTTDAPQWIRPVLPDDAGLGAARTLPGPAVGFEWGGPWLLVTFAHSFREPSGTALADEDIDAGFLVLERATGEPAVLQSGGAWSPRLWAGE